MIDLVVQTLEVILVVVVDKASVPVELAVDNLMQEEQMVKEAT